MSEQGHIQLQVKNKIAYVSFYHPASNSFPSYLLANLTKTICSLNDNDEVNLIVLQSEGERTFCAGASFDELLQVDNQEVGEQFFSGFAHVINAMRKSTKIIIGRVQGKAVGGGVGLVSACDYVFAVDSAAVKLSELAIGIGPFVIEPRSEEHTSELQSRPHLVCRLLLEKKKIKTYVDRHSCIAT